MNDPRYETVDGHIHGWEPIPLCAARYRCACGAFGWKDPRGTMHVKKEGGYPDGSRSFVKLNAGSRKPTMGQQEERMGVPVWFDPWRMSW
jgi:hypothetical protein